MALGIFQFKRTNSSSIGYRINDANIANASANERNNNGVGPKGNITDYTDNSVQSNNAPMANQDLKVNDFVHDSSNADNSFTSPTNNEQLQTSNETSFASIPNGASNQPEIQNEDIVSSPISNINNYESAFEVGNRLANVNGEIKDIGHSQNVNGRIVVSFVAIRELFGALVIEDESGIYVKRGNTEIYFDKDRNMYVNGQLQELDVKPINVNGETLLPVRAICDALGEGVTWNDGMITITNNYLKEQEAFISKDETGTLRMEEIAPINVPGFSNMQTAYGYNDEQMTKLMISWNQMKETYGYTDAEIHKLISACYGEDTNPTGVKAVATTLLNRIDNAQGRGMTTNNPNWFITNAAKSDPNGNGSHPLAQLQAQGQFSVLKGNAPYRSAQLDISIVPAIAIEGFFEVFNNTSVRMHDYLSFCSASGGRSGERIGNNIFY